MTIDPIELMLHESLKRGYITVAPGRLRRLRRRFAETSLGSQGFFVTVIPRRRFAIIEAGSSGHENMLTEAGERAAHDALTPYLRAAQAAGWKREWSACSGFGVNAVLVEHADEAAAKLVELYRDPAMRPPALHMPMVAS